MLIAGGYCYCSDDVELAVSIRYAHFKADVQAMNELAKRNGLDEDLRERVEAVQQTSCTCKDTSKFKLKCNPSRQLLARQPPRGLHTACRQTRPLFICERHPEAQPARQHPSRKTGEHLVFTKGPAQPQHHT